MNDNALIVRHDGVVDVSGRLTFHTVPDFVARGESLFNGSVGTITVDMAGVTAADSAGVALMLEWMAQAQARRCELRFVNLHQQLRNLIAVSGLDHAFGLD